MRSWARLAAGGLTAGDYLTRESMPLTDQASSISGTGRQGGPGGGSSGRVLQPQNMTRWNGARFIALLASGRSELRHGADRIANVGETPSVAAGRAGSVTVALPRHPIRIGFLRMRQYREVVGFALQLRGNALMVQTLRAVGDMGNDVSRFISLSDASGGGHLPDFFGAVAAGSASRDSEPRLDPARS